MLATSTTQPSQKMASIAPAATGWLTVQTGDPAGLAARWAEVLDRPYDKRNGTAVVAVDGAELAFVPLQDDRGEGIHSVALAVSDEVRRARREVLVGGVRFELR